MALFDFLKKKEEIKKSLGRRPMGEAKKPAKKAEKVSNAKKEVKKQEKPAVESKPVFTKTSKGTGFSFEVIKEPHISEKATDMSEKNQYTFKVLAQSNKNEIKKSIEGIYGVDVLSVNLIKIPSKKRRLGKTEGFRKKYKKAVVKIKEGQKIEIL